MSLLHSLVGRLPRRWIKAVGRAQWKHPLLRRAVEFAADRFRRADSVIQSGAGKGLRFNAGSTNAGYILGTTEPDLQAALKALVTPGMSVFDVGANVGFFTVISARLVGANGKVIAFEPLPANVELLRHNAALNAFAHAAVRNEALGRATGTAPFIVSDTPTWGRLASAGELPSEVGRIEVPLRTLDSLLFDEPASVPRPDLIKIDVEGAEADVLAGAARVLREARPILLIELHGTNAAIADALEKLEYAAHVLGGGGIGVREANWDVKVIGVPRERDDLVDVISALQSPDVKN
jgi:FkbM family methyltransferase